MDNDAHQAEQWKRKYYDSLEQAEKKEKQWLRSEDLLRRTLSRLTLAADGLHPTLDFQLRDLRNAIRDKADDRELNRCIEAMSGTLVELDETRQREARAPGINDRLIALLEALTPPRGMARQTRILHKKLESTDDANIETAIDAFAAYLQESFGAATESPAPASETGGGLLGKLFGRGKPAIAESADAAAAGGNAPDAQALFLYLLDKIDKHTGNNVQSLRQRGRTADTDPALRTLADELAALWPAASAEQPQSAARPAQISPTPDDVPAPSSSRQSEVLLQLVEQLNLPGEMQAQVDTVKDRLENSDDAEWPSLLEDIAGLVGEMRERVQQEKLDIQTFLTQLTENLQRLDQQLQGTEALRAESRADGERLDAAVKDQVLGMQSSMHNATELGELKQAIQQRLDTLSTHMQDWRETEAQRHVQAESQMQILTTRLHDLEHESGELRERVLAERRQALTDTLTGLPNRLAFDERMALEYARWKRFDTPLTLVVWDVDHFKRINDTYGHKAGDKVLSKIANVLAERIRETDFLARYGGEEFVMLLPGADPRHSRVVADDLRDTIETCGFHYRDEQVTITISAGIAGFRKDDSPERVFERADTALYLAKQQGRNRVLVAD